ncbi:hypothetical protein ACEPAF_6267 [Sanghuangporus sanghuang]
MAGKKRSWNTMQNSDDEDEPLVGRQILPVANLPETFSGEPKDGLQYLFMVRRDAKKLPFYSRAQNPYESIAAKPQTKAQVVKESHVILPSEEWRTVFIKRFKNFRKNSLQSTIGVELPSLPSSGQSKLMPEKKERDKWWAFINGRPEHEWNPPKSPKKPRGKFARQSIHLDQPNVDDVGQYEVPMTEEMPTDVAEAHEVLVVNEFGEIREDEKDPDRDLQELEVGDAALLSTPFATPQPEKRFKASERRTAGPRHPTPTLLKRMDSRYCMHLLMYFSHWITQHLEHLESGQISSPFSHLSQSHARWMFALLSRVDDHLTSDELSTLRGLARACIAFIKDLNKNSGTSVLSSDGNLGGSSGVRWVGDPSDAPLDERACWMIVTIVTDFWVQKDLWIDAESALNGY